MSTICKPCNDAVSCLDNLDRYSLQDDVYYYVFNCPPGYFCGGRNLIYLVCCDGTTEQLTIPEGATTAQRDALIAGLVARCAAKLAFCDGGGGGGGGGGGTTTEDPPPGTDPENPLVYYGNKPKSWSVKCPDGSTFTYTIQAGTVYAPTQAEADAKALALAKAAAIAYRVCLSTPTATACTNEPYLSKIEASGGTGQFNWSISGTLPTGLTAIPINPRFLRISGTPTVAGTYSFTVRAVDTSGHHMQKTITITVNQCTACPTPASVTYTTPGGPDKQFNNAVYLFENMAAIGPSQKICTFSTDTTLRCMDIIDFTGVPALSSDFLMNAEIDWQCRGAIYEPTTGLIAAIVTKALNQDRVAFFDPTTGYVDSIQLATTTPADKKWEGQLMRGASGQIAFYRGSYYAGDAAYIYVFDAAAKTIVNFFTFPSPAPNIYSDGDFCYGCNPNEFYFTGSVALGHVNLYCINATTGVQRAAYDVTVLATPGYKCAWLDSEDLIALKRPTTYVDLIDPTTGLTILTRDLDDGTIFPTVGEDDFFKYNFKLDALMIGITFYEHPASVGPGTGVLYLRPSNLGVVEFTKTFVGFASSSPLGAAAESNGDLYLQYNANGVNFPFQQIRATIT